MQIIIHGRNIEITPVMREYIEKKLHKLSRYFEQIAEVQFHVSTQRNFKTAEVTVNANGHMVRAEERTPDLHTSIDQVVAKLENQLKHYKERTVDRNRRPQRHGLMHADERHRAMPESAEGDRPHALHLDDSREPAELSIVRRKRFSLEIMSAEEAAERMQLVGHDFFMFLNDETRHINVVYERREGGFGVLEPENEPEDAQAAD
ncbi:MAG: ribosome-associated translation inhibitor RaiA [Armatimonadota bacterium]|nr:ribosome-associated translation inhibitor RaiA [Armatimonadota bacterium]